MSSFEKKTPIPCRAIFKDDRFRSGSLFPDISKEKILYVRSASEICKCTAAAMRSDSKFTLHKIAAELSSVHYVCLCGCSVGCGIIDRLIAPSCQAPHSRRATWQACNALTTQRNEIIATRVRTDGYGSAGACEFRGESADSRE